MMYDGGTTHPTKSSLWCVCRIFGYSNKLPPQIPSHARHKLRTKPNYDSHSLSLSFFPFRGVLGCRHNNYNQFLSNNHYFCICRPNVVTVIFQPCRPFDTSHLVIHDRCNLPYNNLNKTNFKIYNERNKFIISSHKHHSECTLYNL
jgi:hypothetical protein